MDIWTAERPVIHRRTDERVLGSKKGDAISPEESLFVDSRSLSWIYEKRISAGTKPSNDKNSSLQVG
jgi:hypothetical protein